LFQPRNRILSRYGVLLAVHHKVEVDRRRCRVVHVALEPKRPEELLLVFWVGEAHEVDRAVAEDVLLVQLAAERLDQRVQINLRHQLLREEVAATSELLGEELVVGAD
jgi:hypothetical protein